MRAALRSPPRRDSVISAVPRSPAGKRPDGGPAFPGAHAVLRALDVDARYHIGVLDLTGGNPVAALAQADTIRRAVPTHLFAFMLRARALELERDRAGARRAYRDFLAHEAAERTRQRPEYSEHAENLDAFHGQATAATAGKATGGS